MTFNRLLTWAKTAGLCVGLLLLATTGGLAQTVFNTNVRVGYQGGDNWEPGMLADNFGHLYVVFYQEPDSPVSCSGCLNHLLIQRSDDGGNTWISPVMPDPVKTKGQADAWLQLDPDGKTIWMTYFNGVSQVQIEVVKSSDYGVTWSTPISLSGFPQPHMDKPVSAIRGGTSAGNVYLSCWDDNTNLYTAVSYNGWASWHNYTVYTLSFSNPTQFLCSGAGIDSKGNLYLTSDWTNGSQSLVRVDKSSNGGSTWTEVFSATGPAPYPCSNCGAGSYFAPQINLAVGSDDTVYILWNNAPTMTDGAPNRIYFSSSTNYGVSWSMPQDVSLAASGVEHSFPSVLAGRTAGDVRIAWQDNRNSGYWNTMYRSSTNGGASFSPESFVSNYNYVPGYSYLTTLGYQFPYGDQFRMAIDASGKIHMAWGETPAYTSIGNSWVGNQQ